MAFAGSLLASPGCSVGQWSLRKGDIKCCCKNQKGAHKVLVRVGCSSLIARAVGKRSWSSAWCGVRRDAGGERRHCSLNEYSISRLSINVPRGLEMVRPRWVPSCKGPSEVGARGGISTAERDSLLMQGMRGSDDMYDNVARLRGSEDCDADCDELAGDSKVATDCDGIESSAEKQECKGDEMSEKNNDVKMSKPGSISDVACQLKFVVPNSLSGCIIGKSGGNLNRIREKTGAFVQASAPGSTVASPKDRMIIIAGESMSYCLWGLVELVDSIRKAGKERMLMNGSRYSLRQVIPGSSTVKVFGMRSRLVAYVQTCIGIDLTMDPRPPNASMTPFRIVRYSSHSLDSLLQGVAKVCVALDSETYQKEIKEIKSIVLRVVKVPKSRVGVIIGAKGTRLKALEDVLNCKFAIENDSPDSNDAYITIWGHPKNVYVAVQVLLLKSNEKDGQRVATGAAKTRKPQGNPNSKQ